MPAIRAARAAQVPEIGLSRRQLLRRSVGAAVALWIAEVLGGTLGFLWPNAALGALRVRVGTLADVEAGSPGLPVRDGFPGYVPAARAFVVLVDPADPRFRPGEDATGTGQGVNVLALSQRCPHLGCRPNPCLDDYWFHCPCHQSRYDRFGVKAAGERYGPAARGMDRFGVSVDEAGVLTIDGARIVLGPLPVALGQPGIIPRRWSTDACELNGARWLALYPAAWRERYGEEMADLLDATPTGWPTRLDLARGALDAHLHPMRAVRWPAYAAALGGIPWTFAAAYAAGQPAPPDWPAYLLETLPLMAAAAAMLIVATLGITTRLGDADPLDVRVGRVVGATASLAWSLLLGAAAAGAGVEPAAAIAGQVAGGGFLLLGSGMLRANDTVAAMLLFVAALGAMAPIIWAPIAFGAAWAGLAVVHVLDPRPVGGPPATRA